MPMTDEKKPKIKQPDWEKIDSKFHEVFDSFRDDGLTYFEVDSIITLLKTECETAKYTHIIKANLERLGYEVDLQDKDLVSPSSAISPYN